MLRFLDGGESHGKGLVAILEGIPSNCEINIEKINEELSRRQKGYGRGKRMAIESDKVEIWSGLRGNKTTGNPVTLVIYNKDYDNWKEFFKREPKEEEIIKNARPGHGDLVGFYKYRTGDIRDVIERTSARETAIRTAVGAFCKQVLNNFNIEIRSKVKSIGEVYDIDCDLYKEEVWEKVLKSQVSIFDKHCENRAKELIDRCKEEGNTIGGTIFVSIKGVPLGLGSYSQWDRKLDAIISKGIMSLQGIKSISFGRINDLSLLGKNFQDEIFYENGKIIRDTNNAGGIEAGVSNGENIEFTALMKPIPSIKGGIRSVDLVNKFNVESRYERSDVCAVVPAAVVIENICAFEILKEFLQKFGGDELEEIKSNLYRFLSTLY
ncbi:chorismate synthase [Clostridium fallax]|uniref:Chorismate synthase n=1 Tax=Clostridium fallax TaxID=1533 RepID=A0A1M4WWL8_9CLOT|nr:chorismate synthase [Clostridium fallax]